MLNRVISHFDLLKSNWPYVFSYLTPVISIIIFSVTIKSVNPDVIELRLPIFQGISCIINLINLSILYSKSNKFPIIEYLVFNIVSILFLFNYYEKFHQATYIFSIYVIFGVLNLFSIYIIKIINSIKLYGLFNIFIALIIPLNFFCPDNFLLIFSLLFILIIIVFFNLVNYKFSFTINFKPSLISFISQSPLLLYPLFDKYISLAMPINFYTTYVVYSKFIYGGINWLFIYYNVKLINNRINFKKSNILFLIALSLFFIIIPYFSNSTYFYLTFGLISTALLSNLTSINIRNSTDSIIQIICSIIALSTYIIYMIYWYDHGQIWQFILFMYILFIIPSFPYLLIVFRPSKFKL